MLESKDLQVCMCPSLPAQSRKAAQTPPRVMGGLLEHCVEGPDPGNALQSVEGGAGQGGSSCPGRSWVNLQVSQRPVRAATRHLSKGTGIWGRSLPVPPAMEPGHSALVPSFTWPVELLFVLFLFKDVQPLWESIFPVALIRLCWNK